MPHHRVFLRTAIALAIVWGIALGGVFAVQAWRGEIEDETMHPAAKEYRQQQRRAWREMTGRLERHGEEEPSPTGQTLTDDELLLADVAGRFAEAFAEVLNDMPDEKRKELAALIVEQIQDGGGVDQDGQLRPDTIQQMMPVILTTIVTNLDEKTLQDFQPAIAELRQRLFESFENDFGGFNPGGALR